MIDAQRNESGLETVMAQRHRRVLSQGRHKFMRASCADNISKLRQPVAEINSN